MHGSAVFRSRRDLGRFPWPWWMVLLVLTGCPCFSTWAGETLTARLTPLRTTSESWPAAPGGLLDRPKVDWLIQTPARQASLHRGVNDQELVLDNGLIRRVFRLAPNAATIRFDNLMTGESLLRSVKPEALITLNGHEWPIGGLTGQTQQAYLLPEWIDELKTIPGAFQFVGYQSGPIAARLEWKRRRHAADLPWPPSGLHLVFHFQGGADSWPGLGLEVHYELYDGLPVLGKWIAFTNSTDQVLTLDTFTSELLATVERESVVDERDSGQWLLPAIDFLSDYSFHGMDVRTAERVKVWLPDPGYASQVNYRRETPALLVSRPPLGPGLALAPGEIFQSHRTWLVVQDGDDRERQGLALRRAQRALAPWCTENPIMMHVRSAQSDVFRHAVDQCAAVGFEMIIYTFGSGLNMESEDVAYLDRIKADVDYAHERGLEVGAYSLLASRRVSDEHDVIHPETGRPGGAIFGNSPCLGSAWAEDYFRRIRHFMDYTGLDLLEHDGSYPGDVCASTQHPGHQGLADSQWRQWERIVDLYQWCRARGIYLNVPDSYFLAGSSKTGMGYRESNWSLPRAEQIILARQNIYDGTWQKAPSMGWMFVPLVEYHGGGAAATLEPLSEHLDAYEAHLANNFGAGVQACFRGPRLYDTEATKAVVSKWVGWFKAHRDILESDIIHLRRPDGREVDGFLHVNPARSTRAMLVLYNPLNEPLARMLPVPLYYAGLKERVKVREQQGPWRHLPLDSSSRLQLPVEIPARGVTWYLFEEP